MKCRKSYSSNLSGAEIKIQLSKKTLPVGIFDDMMCVVYQIITIIEHDKCLFKSEDAVKGEIT